MNERAPRPRAAVLAFIASMSSITGDAVRYEYSFIELVSMLAQSHCNGVPPGVYHA